MPTVIGPLGLLAAALAAAFIPPASGVDAALLGRTTIAQTLTASNWSVVVNGTSGAKTVTPGATVATFTLTNNGNVALTNTAAAVTVTVRNNFSVPVRICPAAGACTSGGTSVAAGATTVIAHTAAQGPQAIGITRTWAFLRSGAGAGTITISASVSSIRITPAPGTTNS